MTLAYTINYTKQKVFKPLIEINPRLYVRVQKFRYRHRPFKYKLVDKNTAITIEGYPRSANSFSVRAFESAQNGRKYKIGNHTHSFAQVIRSVQLGVPTIVLIRKPVEAIVSMGALELHTMKGDLNQFVRTRDMAWNAESYATFYNKLLPYIDNVVVAPFEEVIHDFGQFIDNVNDKFDTSFALFEHSKINQERIFQSSRKHLSPSTEREKQKVFITNLLNEGRCPMLMKESQDIFETWMSKINYS